MLIFKAGGFQIRPNGASLSSCWVERQIRSNGTYTTRYSRNTDTLTEPRCRRGLTVFTVYGTTDTRLHLADVGFSVRIYTL
jgi:hypothetical protein